MWLGRIAIMMGMKPKKINLDDKFSLFEEPWTPKIVGILNESLIKVAKFSGEFVWHKHDGEDELFWVHTGRLRIHFEKDVKVDLCEGEFIVVRKGVMHKPEALSDEVQVVLIEPRST
jgi:mannose-6-phosphate isomerase-like protein (cupin superfamily)